MIKINKQKMTSTEEKHLAHLLAKDALGEMTSDEARQRVEYMAKYAYDTEQDPFEQWNDKAMQLKALHPELTIEQARIQIADSNDWIRERIDQ